MTTEVMAQLAPRSDGHYLDCTVGGGGHARVLLEAGAGRVLGIDRDPDAVSVAAATLSGWSARTELVHADFRDIDSVLDELQRARRTVDKARDAANEGRRVLDDVLRPPA